MWEIDAVLDLLERHHQRATYGAVARVTGRSAQGVMRDQLPSFRCSWVVAAKTNLNRGSRRGWPTGYTDNQIDPICFQQISENRNLFICDETILLNWLNTHNN